MKNNKPRPVPANNKNRNTKAESLRSFKKKNPRITKSIGLSYAKKTKSKNPKTMIVSNTELVKVLVGNGGYQANQMIINPNNPALCPWLSQLALAYDKYKIKRLDFKYITSAPTTTNGQFWMYFDTDPTASVAQNMSQVLVNQGAKVDACYRNFSMSYAPFKRDESLKSYYIYDLYSPPTGNEIKQYSPVTINFGTQGVPNASAVGRLLVKYEIELENPDFTGSTSAFQSWKASAPSNVNLFPSHESDVVYNSSTTSIINLS